MAEMLTSIAIDIGASGGRVILGQFDGKQIKIEELYRFPNSPIRVGESVYWDALYLLEEVKSGLRLTAREYCPEPASIGLDTWGTDFSLISKNGSLVDNPHSYRDPRTDGMMEEAFKKVSRHEIYRQTGVQFMQFNPLYQLYSMVLSESPDLQIADTFLMIPDLFNYWLSGEKVCEFTNATTTQFYNPVKGNWAYDLLDSLNIPTRIFPSIQQPATILGNLSPWMQDDTGLKNVPIVAVASHDTASAACAVPASHNKYAFLSSGTWSLLGAEVYQPVINETGLKHNLSCYGGICDTFLEWKNIQALWLLQECQRTWSESGSNYSHQDLINLAKASQPFCAVIDSDDRIFLDPGDMPSKIRLFCERTHQQPPQTPGAIVRCIFESLALKYRWVFENLQKVIGEQLDTIHLVGGGSKNKYLAQFTADATARRVLAGPTEATTIGNLVAQLIALGQLNSLEGAREIIRNSFETDLYAPQNPEIWDDPYQIFLDLMAG